MENQDFKRKVKFILKFGRALHTVGAPAHTLEGVMQEMCQLLRIKGNIVSLPTAIFTSFREGDEEVARIERVEPMGSVNLGKLSEVDCVARELISGKKTYEEASQALDDIFTAPEFYGKRMMLGCFVFYAAGFVVLLGGTWGDFISAIVVGSIIGLFSLFKPNRVSQLFEALMAIIASFVTILLAKLLPGLNEGAIILSSLIMFVPGLYITIAIAEIATNNLTSGTSRLVGGAMTLLKLTFGVFIGSKIATWFHYRPWDYSFAPIPTWFVYVFLPIIALLSMVNFKADKKDWKIVTMAGIFGYLVSRLGTHYLGPELGLFFGGASVGAMSNIFARVSNRPSSIFQFPGIILLVPGSVGYRSLNFLFERDVVGGLNTAFTMVTLAMALVVGLFLGNVLVKPRQSF